MEPSKEPVSVRIARIDAEITGKCDSLRKRPSFARESLLDAFQVLYDECSTEGLQKYDSNILSFVDKYKTAVKEIKSLRVNISDFEIKNIVGRGHFGEVHVVKEKQTGYVYAMKTVRKFDNETKRISFEEERNIMAYSTSPWLTSLQYAFQDRSYLYFIMDYHPGGDLLGLLYRQGGTLPESAALFYVAELVLALEDLHAMGYVHRDIKPDNVLLDRCGHLKLADFGSAAKLNKNGFVKLSPPVGTPDYIAPEVLQCMDNKNEKSCGYGVSCDFWSLGVLAYEITIGNTPFQAQNTTSIYSKIMNHSSNLKFPPDLVLSQAYVSFVKALIADNKKRLDREKIRNHPVFKDINFDTLKDQVPPYVPKIASVDDTSNFTDIQVKKKQPSIENFKRKTQFSGRNLPFVGFTFTHDQNCGFQPNFRRRSIQKDELVENLRTEIETLRLKLSKTGDFDQEKESMEKKLEERELKVENLECLRDKLEKDLATGIAENTAIKRTLELERKDRVELEKKALDLIKSAKLKWELSEKVKVDALTLEIEQQKEKINQLSNTNRTLEEQLQHALKMEDEHRQSLEHVENLSRRSVIGLENRLEKMIAEAEGTISELQLKLNDETHKSNVLQNKLIKIKENELTLKEQLSTTELDYRHLKEKVDEAESVIKQLSTRVNDLERTVDTIDEYKKEIRELEHLFDNSQKAVKDLQNRNSMLHNESRMLEDYKKEIEDMKEKIVIMQNDKRIASLERELEEEKQRCRSLKKRLEDTENVVTENQELKEMRTKFWRMEKEFGNCKIDKRILERELKDAQNEIKQLNVKISEHNQKMEDIKKAHEAAILELGNINENLSMELIRCKESYKTLQEHLNSEKDRMNLSKMAINELNGVIASDEQKIRASAEEIKGLRNEVASLEGRCKREEGERLKLIGFVEELQKEKGKTRSELEQCRREIHNAHLNLEALREACTLLEGQVIEYEKLNASQRQKEIDLNSNTEKLIGDLCKARQETQDARKQINEQKSLKAAAESKIKRLEEDVACLENESKSYKQQCMEYKQYSAGLSDELTVAEEKLGTCEVQLKSCERQIKTMSSENKILKEEISEYITQIGKLKDSNYKLGHQLGDFKENNVCLVQKIRELERILGEKTHYYNERELKSDATIKQQIKLIDYLQSKIDEQSHKKKTFTEVIFGGSKKENQPPATMALNYKDLEHQLVKERQSNRQLQEEVYKLKAATLNEVNSSMMEKMGKSEILSPKSKTALSQIVMSPGSQKDDLRRQNSVQRMHHNIPHRFETKLCMKSQKCYHCGALISLGRNSSTCKECSLTVHTTCSSAVPRTCGLPKMFADHYKESLHKVTEDEDKGDSMEKKELVEAANVEGWVKVPCTKTNGWLKRYVRLTSSSLDVYSQPPSESGSAILESFSLKLDDSHGKVVLEPVVSEIGVPVASSDLPFIMKVEIAPNTTCWPPRCFILMTLSAKEKDSWFNALQKVFHQDQTEPRLEPITRIPENLTLNHVLDLTDKIRLLATDEGLFSHHESTVTKLGGPKKVEQVAIFAPANLVLMLAEPKSSLVSCDLNHLINLAQCGVRSKPEMKHKAVKVNGLSGFCILQVSKQSSHKKICVATDKQLVIMDYCFDRKEFIPTRILDTAQPTSCLLFTDNSLIVGADKFFEIDLNSYQAEEFLDVSDKQLHQAMKCYKMGSFPRSVLEISSNPKEYLLSFNEFSIFVDEYGRSSRQKEIKSVHLPLAFHMAKHYLYVVQFLAVEFIKINEETCNGDCLDTFRLELSKFRYLGANSNGVYVEQDGEVKLVNARKFVDLDVNSIVSESTENEYDNESDRFSFTSSMVQSLDGNLTESDTVDDSQKDRRVKFNQTDL